MKDMPKKVKILSIAAVLFALASLGLIIAPMTTEGNALLTAGLAAGVVAAVLRQLAAKDGKESGENR